MSRLCLAGVLLRLLPEEHVLRLRGLLFRDLQQPLGPDVFRREDRETGDDHEQPRPGEHEHRGTSEDDDEAGDRDRDTLAVPTDESPDNLERNDGRVVVPPAGELWATRLEFLDELRGIDLLRLVAPYLVPEGVPALPPIRIAFGRHAIEFRTVSRDWLPTEIVTLERNIS